MVVSLVRAMSWVPEKRASTHWGETSERWQGKSLIYLIIPPGPLKLYGEGAGRRTTGQWPVSPLVLANRLLLIVRKGQLHADNSAT